MNVIYNIAMRHCDDSVIATVDFDHQGTDGTRYAVFQQKYADFYGNSPVLAQNAIMDEIRDFAESKS
jgi:hypothetical protein